MSLRVRIEASVLVAATLLAVASVTVHASAEEPSSAADPPPLPPPQGPAPSVEPSADHGQVQPAPNEDVGSETTAALRLRQLDFRGTINADLGLAYVGLGASADLGVVPVGPGTIAVGAGFEYDFCGTACSLPSSLTPIDFSQRQIWPQARASYHFGLKKAKNVDVYPFVGLGPVFARSEISVDNNAARYVGTDTSVGVNFGAGLNLFVAGPVFVGGEARIRYAAGDYNYRLEFGDGTRMYDREGIETWRLTGVDLVVAVGVRLP